MSDDAIDRQELRRMRGQIIRALWSFYGGTPDTITAETLRRHVMRLNAGRERMYTLALGYLCDKGAGFVERIEDRMDALDREPMVFYRLTARGANLKNGEITDPGVDLE
jgi:hypothetical protein